MRYVPLGIRAGAHPWSWPDPNFGPQLRAEWHAGYLPGRDLHPAIPSDTYQESCPGGCLVCNTKKWPTYESIANGPTHTDDSTKTGSHPADGPFPLGVRTAAGHGTLY